MGFAHSDSGSFLEICRHAVAQLAGSGSGMPALAVSAALGALSPTARGFLAACASAGFETARTALVGTVAVVAAVAVGSCTAHFDPGSPTGSAKWRESLGWRKIPDWTRTSCTEQAHI